MHDLNEPLPDLMHRATEYLEPESPDLVERGIRRGQVLRRRRTTLLGFTASAAVLATAGLVVSGNQALGGSGPIDGQVAGTVTTTTQTTAPPRVAGQATPKTTLEILRGLLPIGVQVSQPKTWGDNFLAASYLADDGKGASYVEVQMITEKSQVKCGAEHPENCTVLPDGTLVITSQGRADEPLFNAVTIAYRDGRTISVASANAAYLKQAAPTRPQPLLSLKELTKLAASTAWKFPPLGYGKDLNR